MRMAATWAASLPSSTRHLSAAILAGTSPPPDSTRVRSARLSGAFIPFAKTKAERVARNDPRLSLEERYGTHQAYVDAVKKAAAKAVTERFLLPADADRLIAEAAASDVLIGK